MINVVIARHAQDVSWINDLPQHCTVHLYNRAEMVAPDVFTRQVRQTALRNVVDDTGAFLYHLIHDAEPSQAEFTVFTSADPFAHAPAWFELLLQPQRWGDIQPLSVLADERRAIPPRHLIERDRRDWIGSAAIRAERYSLTSLAPMGFFDEQTHRIAELYRRKQNLPDGANLVAHFLAMCGFERLASEAQQADTGVFAYGPVFAVRNTRLAGFLHEARPHLGKLDVLTRASPVHQHFFERVWLHFFGLPFGRFDAIQRPADSLAPVVPVIVSRPAATDTVVAHAPATVQRRALPPSAIPALSVELLRAKARQAVSAGHPEDAQRLLGVALQKEPRNLELLAEVAELAFQFSDFHSAIINSRRALLIQPEHAGCQFTLAMALAASGENREALEMFDTLMHGEAAREFLRRHPERLTEAQREAQRVHDELSSEPHQAVA
ncbi:MAG: hypothetical protein RLY71_914 [Pseudomonadota bacterium]|jgi:hypothetical protein